jgi:outer membrane protein insertion porin family
MRLKLVPALVAGMFATQAWALDPFVVKDIRVEGIQRTDAGTIFSYLPVKVGDSIDDEKAAAAIRALYATGFFRDVRLEAQDGVLIVTVLERPTISAIEITGAKEFEKDTLKKALKDIGLAEARIFDRSALDRAEQEIKRQYISRGRYAAEVSTIVTPQERNRASINFVVTEGEVAKIAQINIVGNSAFSEKDLLSEMVLTTPGWLTWYTKNDQYSKQKLSADLETLRSFYTNRGYLEFNVESTQVSITPDKEEIYITVNITEGPKYTVGEIRMGGELLLPEAELRRLITLRTGETFSRERLTESAKLVGDRLGQEGYAFANVNAIPEIDRSKREASFTFFVDPGRRVYVRRINITGNTRTRDEVIRREMRQLEGAWYDNSKIQRSKIRVDRLGFFSEVNVETPSVAGANDQIDVEVAVVEKPTGTLNLGAGFSQGDGLILSGSIAQQNVFGSGNALSLQLNSSRVNRTYAISYTNPYFTPDGISRGFDVYRKDVDATSLTIASYKTKTYGAGVRFGIPLTETDSVNFGLAAERTEIELSSIAPIRYLDYINTFGSLTNSLVGRVGWARDSRDSILYPTRGRFQTITGEFGIPGTDLQYYKINYQHQWFKPIPIPFFRDLVLALNGEVGYGDGYGGKPLPFYKAYYAGGVNSVRGYDTSTLGPRDENGDPIGGNRRIVGNAELLFPFPGLSKDKSVRASLFFDAGQIKGQGTQPDFEGFRFSTGLAIQWASPVGPLKFSFAFPLAKKEGDRVQRFQFQVGAGF